ncbi:Hydroxyacylglutathione hydrolase cytoplasmic [Dichanthelium oligosanthes]|uniref:hydroxyacylglutathione hydrolase n=1 Tax=Dichanthelium oligosanthes TaxID=888268 RepID=A0A1E5VGH4_9POAL|nr:Hydroxyacylglutathione hydrolase cytoplasmic [Dichanthelium oligosanthes]
MKIIPVPCLEDNYAYLYESVLMVQVEQYHVRHKSIVLFWDHAGGNEKMRQQVSGIKVFGGSLDNVKGCTDQVENGTKLSLGKDIEILCLHTPWYSICYDPFIAGCGRFFEGTAEQMYQSLIVTLGSLPKSTQVYCGHEYTVKSLKFMLTLEPDNEKTKQKLEWAEKQREANQPTVPSTIGDEFEINTFMRVDLPEIQAKFGTKSPVEALREVRKIKDNWKG